MRRKSSRNSKKSTGEKSEIDPLKTSSNNSDAVRSSKRWASEVENEQDKNQSDNPSQEGEDGTQNVITDHDDATENVANDQSVKESACKDTDVQEEGASEEKDNEGKLGKHYKNDESWGNQPEIQNDNTQGSSQSPPKDNNENAQNSVETAKTHSEESRESSNGNNAEKMASEPENVAENQTNFESAYVDDSKVPRENLIGDNQISNDNMDSEERSTTPEIKTPKKSRFDVIVRSQSDDTDKKQTSEKKRITLRRLPPKSTQELEISQKSKEEDTKDKPSKKVIIKRHTVDEKTSGNVEKREVQQRSPSRKSSTSEENVEKRRRLSSQSEEKPNTEEAKETMKVKVKLIRHLSQPNPGQENAIPLKTHKQSWGKSSWLDNISATMYKIDVDTIKIVCPSVEFLKENEVKLDLVPRERVKSESEFVKRKLSIDKSEEEPEKYEKQVPEESTDEQKIDSNPNIIAINRKISIVDDTASKLKPPPSPARNPRSEILYITNLVRPFTVKQLKELLERTGKIREDGFWTDRIKSKCYAHYESEEEAEATRNALHGINWPIGNGKQLVIDYATTEDMEKAKKPVPLPAAPVVPDKIPEKENREPEKLDNRHREREREERKRHTPPREWISGKEEAHRRHSRSRSRSRDRERIRKHSHRSYTPEIVNKKKPRKIEEPVPQKLMDDLFLKTKATPSIYWQPLTPEEIATKQQQRLVRMEQFKRRIEETRGRMRDVRRAPFRRR